MACTPHGPAEHGRASPTWSVWRPRDGGVSTRNPPRSIPATPSSRPKTASPPGGPAPHGHDCDPIAVPASLRQGCRLSPEELPLSGASISALPHRRNTASPRRMYHSNNSTGKHRLASVRLATDRTYRSNRYPSPRTVFKWDEPGPSPIFCLTRATWTSTVRVAVSLS